MITKTEKENYQFKECLDSAIGNITEAIGEIHYPSYIIELNTEAIKKLETAISIIEDVVDMDIFKPK